MFQYGALRSQFPQCEKNESAQEHNVGAQVVVSGFVQTSPELAKEISEHCGECGASDGRDYDNAGRQAINITLQVITEDKIAGIPDRNYRLYARGPVKHAFKNGR